MEELLQKILPKRTLAWVPHDLHVEDHAEEYPTPGFGLEIWDVGFAFTLSIKIAHNRVFGPKSLKI